MKSWQSLLFIFIAILIVLISQITFSEWKLFCLHMNDNLIRFISILADLFKNLPFGFPLKKYWIVSFDLK